jgi:hypothetical protein
MPSIFDSMKRMGAVPSMMAALGETEAITYKPSQGDAFKCDAIVGREEGGEVYDPDAGDTMKVRRLTVKRSGRCAFGQTSNAAPDKRGCYRQGPRLVD